MDWKIRQEALKRKFLAEDIELYGFRNCRSQSEIDNSHTILEKIARMYADKLLSDIVLVVGKREFPAHRLVLCASSDVFQIMLMNPEWSESREQRIVLQEAPECVLVFERFLWYLYSGRLIVSHGNVLPILVLADKYNVKDLVDICSSYMMKHCVSAAKQNYLISWLQYAVSCGHTEVSDMLMNYTKWNFEQVASSKDFVTCDIGLLSTILAQDDLKVHDEMTLYNYVVQWLSHQEETLFVDNEAGESNIQNTEANYPPSIQPKCRKYFFQSDSSSVTEDSLDPIECLTYEIMRYIRFPMMTPRQLAELLLVTLTIKYKEFFVTRMAIGMSFHSGQWERVQEVICDSDPANQLLFTPRYYTVENWSSSLTIMNLPYLPAYHTRTLVFSTPSSASEIENSDSQIEWIVELYPKGVWFQKFSLIIWQGSQEVPETVLKTIRVAITAKDTEFARVRVAVLVYGIQDDIEHVTHVVSTRHIFTQEDNLLNMDDILPYHILNDTKESKQYLLDPCNSFKIHIVISPLLDPKLYTCKYTKR